MNVLIASGQRDRDMYAHPTCFISVWTLESELNAYVIIRRDVASRDSLDEGAAGQLDILHSLQRDCPSQG